MDAVRQHRHPVRCLHHGQRCLILEQLDGQVLLSGFEVLDDHKSRADARRGSWGRAVSATSPPPSPRHPPQSPGNRPCLSGRPRPQRCSSPQAAFDGLCSCSAPKSSGIEHYKRPNPSINRSIDSAKIFLLGKLRVVWTKIVGFGSTVSIGEEVDRPNFQPVCLSRFIVSPSVAIPRKSPLREPRYIGGVLDS